MTFFNGCLQNFLNKSVKETKLISEFLRRGGGNYPLSPLKKFVEDSLAVCDVLFMNMHVHVYIMCTRTCTCRWVAPLLLFFDVWERTAMIAQYRQPTKEVS